MLASFSVKEGSRVNSGPRSGVRSASARTAAVVLVLALAVMAAAARDDSDDQPLPVRYPEGMLHGFLVLKNQSGTIIARGDQLQTPRRDGRIASRMTFRFTDGSLLDERVVFSQEDVFIVYEYHLSQRGPAFAQNAEAFFERPSRKYRVRTVDSDDGKVDITEGDLDQLPASTYNGMVITLLKNLAPDRSATVRMVAFTPTPRFIGLELTPVGKTRASFGNESKTAVQYAIKPRLGFFLKIGAKLTGKDPPDSHAWIISEDVPAFAKFVGPLSMSGTGAPWTIELTSPTWTQ